ncbi:hypothetical protein QR680_018475 [Steinernema hermaphroditum]|uniref:Uncharacterized protein n=1 Tax=Steinernema hermaphroditum TaxID=289476 RepID=A0AA39LR29_9BILA|nr:hypothetical protein QR680_018475 [Steinernema hermaphroditum]
MSPDSLVAHFREPGCLEIGYTCDDTFDKGHADYEVCCGCCHTQNSGKVVAIVSLLLSFVALGWAVYFKSTFLTAVAGVYIVSALSLIIAVFLERHALILPYIGVSILRELFEVYLIIKMSTGLTHIIEVKDYLSGYHTKNPHSTLESCSAGRPLKNQQIVVLAKSLAFLSNHIPDQS